MREEYRKNLSEALELLEGLVEHLPEAATRPVRNYIREIRELLINQRPPRLAIVGRRGSGKSSFVNAIFGERVAEVGHEKAQTGKPAWHVYEGSRGRLSFLDTRGLAEAHTPEEDDGAKGPVESISQAIREQGPDVILFLAKATEVGAAVDADIRDLKRIWKAAKDAHGVPLPVLAVVNQCDTVEPKSVRLHQPDKEHPEDLQEKRERVATLERLLEDKLREDNDLKASLVKTIGVSSYQSWRESGERRADERWRIDDMIDFLYDELPREARLELVRLSQVKALQKKMSRLLVNLFASASAAVAVTPIPVGDIFPITTLQVQMIVAIGYVSGRGLTLATATEFLTAIGANLGVGMALREAARALAKFVFPGAGNVVSAGVAAAGTKAIGEAAIAYFIDGLSQEKARQVYQSTWLRARADQPDDGAGADERDGVGHAVNDAGDATKPPA